MTKYLFTLLLGFIGCATVPSPFRESDASEAAKQLQPWYEVGQELRQNDVEDIRWIAHRLGMKKIDGMKKSLVGHPIDTPVVLVYGETVPDDEMKFTYTTLTVYHREVKRKLYAPNENSIFRNGWYSDKSELSESILHRFIFDDRHYDLFIGDVIGRERVLEILSAFRQGSIRMFMGCNDHEYELLSDIISKARLELMYILDAQERNELYGDEAHLGESCVVGEESPVKTVIEKLISEPEYVIHFERYTLGQTYWLSKIDDKWYALLVDMWIS